MDYFIERIVTRVNMPILTVFGDLTIGDFWGLGDEVPFYGDIQNGISVVLINNEKGSQFFDEIKNKIFLCHHISDIINILNDYKKYIERSVD